MQITQINVVYKQGSTGKIVYDLHSWLKTAGHQSFVYYGRGAKNDEKDVMKIAPELIMKLQSLRSRITGYAYSGCFISTKRLINQIKMSQPDIVHLHCLNGYFVNIYKLLEFLKKENIPTVLTLHAEFMHTAGCGHAFDCEKWKTGCYDCEQNNIGRSKSWFFDRSTEEWHKMENAFTGFNNLVLCPVSGWLERRAKQSPFLKDKKFHVVENGLDPNVFYHHGDNRLKEKLQLSREKKVILHVTPDFNSPIKGGKYVVELADKLQGENIVVIIVGIKKNIVVPENCIAIEHTNNQKGLAEFYSMADVTLLTSEKETFSMVCAESLSCGTPVVGFKAGAPETISIEEYSEFVDFANVELLKESVVKWLKVEKRTIGISRLIKR